ncbi:Ig-like domain-containing protein [Actinoplanes sp. CA-252034]|uniref:Ig-like domain-containing protein n=1 Tax=Actinoplanes sp. CA-252034 TaxID=3239906 RepID=UPI003D97D561
MIKKHGASISALSTLLLLSTGLPARAADDPVADTIAPVISFLSIPSGGVVGLNPYITANVSDNVGVVRAELWHSRVRLADTGPGTWEVAVFQPSLATIRAAGPVDLEVRAYDAAGNVTSTATTVFIDRDPPTVTVNPGAGTVIPALPLTIELTDVPDDILEISMDAPEPIGTTWRTGGPWTFKWNARKGMTPPVFHLRDRAGNTSIVTTGYFVDADVPNVTSVAPAYNALVRGTRIHSTIQGTDRAGIASAQLKGAAVDIVAPYTGSIPAGADGARTLTWTITDRLGNWRRFDWPVVVDNTKPRLSVTKAPKNKAKVKGTVKVTASASDRNGVARVELLINGKVVAKDYKAGYAFSINTKKYGKKIKFQVRAYDRAGNARITTARTWYR